MVWVAGGDLARESARSLGCADPGRSDEADDEVPVRLGHAYAGVGVVARGERAGAAHLHDQEQAAVQRQTGLAQTRDAARAGQLLERTALPAGISTGEL